VAFSCKTTTKGHTSITSAAPHPELRLLHRNLLRRSWHTIVGGIFSALSADRLPPPQRRQEFAAQVRDALARYEPLTEHIRVSIQLGHGP